MRFELWKQELKVETVNKAQITVDYGTHELGKLLEYKHELEESPSYQRDFEGPLSHSMTEEVKSIARDVLRRVRGMLYGLDTKLQVLREKHAATIPFKVEDSAIPITVVGPNTGNMALKEAVSLQGIFLCVAVAFVALPIVASTLSWFFGVNRFSLHSLYGNRLVRAYPGASNPNRIANPFTNFDLKDDIGLKHLVSGQPPRKLFHVINATPNLGKTQNPEWQQRQGTSFTMSPLHAGSHVTGFQPVAQYGGKDGEDGLTLGRAMTASGAAVSPAWGYHSSKPVALVMTFFNARLGWWLPNPGEDGTGVWSTEEPGLGIRPLITELAGVTNDKSKYVYISDGGHFDNLALYEMVRRRCRLILVVDAGCDPSFEYEDLATALRLIRVDCSIPIEFPCDSGPGQRREPKRHFTIGRIRYSEVDGGEPDEVDGVIAYIKPVLLKDEPVDVTNYAVAARKVGGKFPRDTTADQFFDESQFESYRMLGLMSIEALKKAAGDDALANIPLPSDSDLRRAPVVSGAHDTERGKEEPKQSLINLDGMGNLLPPAAALAGATALTTAIATTVALTVSGSLKLEPPTDPIPVSGSVKLEQPAELRLNSGDKQTLTNLTREKGGLRLNREDLDRLEKLRLKVASPEWSLKVEDKKFEVTPSTVTLNDQGKLQPLTSALGNVAEALRSTDIGMKLDGIDTNPTSTVRGCESRCIKELVSKVATTFRPSRGSEDAPAV